MKLFRKFLLLLWMLVILCVPVFGENLVIERQIYQYLTEQMGLPSSSACGILANIEKESSFNPGAVGDNGTSYGLCQWHDGRFTALKTFCQARDLDYQSVAGQLAYLRYELENTYPELLAQLRVQQNDADGAYRAAYLWCTEFERPVNTEQNGILRGTIARGKYWNRYNSMILVQSEPEVMTEEEVVEAVIQTQVTIPEPPETIAPERQEQSGEETPAVVIGPYIPRHEPKRELKPNWGAAVGTAMLFIPLSDGKKERFDPKTWLCPAGNGLQPGISVV